MVNAQNITTLNCIETLRFIMRRSSRGLDSCHMLERDKYSSTNYVLLQTGLDDNKCARQTEKHVKTI